MLELVNIKKTYTTSNYKVEALKGISLKFREAEFVSILGQSGCGKTTLLNIIGGLDRYSSGDLIINGKSTRKFKDRDWDAYRNYKVGFIFQSYNLISHQTILSNVELALTIGGISRKERKERAIKALEEVGLKEHIHKKPNQLSGGQMQRVAIARALVNDPDIILADEPTGALDTNTSIQVMDILKKISQNKLIIMVTHNKDLAEEYSSRIISILDGNITKDSNPIDENETIENRSISSIGKTSMKFWTAFRLSLNNLLTKKGRTILVSFAGSIGIIGIALILSVSNGFQAYVDSIQEDTLTSYPLTIMQETTDVAGALLAMTSKNNSDKDSGKIKEEQYISKILANLSTNDLKSFKNHLNNNYNEIKNDISSIKYGYSVEPQIYGIDNTKKIVKLSPNDSLNSSFGMGMMGSFGSIYSQMMDDKETINTSYDILAGHLPENYDEMLIVLSEKNTISDLLVYSLGLRNTEELSEIVTKIMSGEKVNINNEALEFTFEDLLNVELKLIMPTELYNYNQEYDIYEDMSKNEEYIKTKYNEALKLKIVGIVTAKEGLTTNALNPGIAYTGQLVEHILENSKKQDIVKKQLENKDVDVLSGKKFDEKSDNLDLDFKDFISIDTENLKEAFNMKIDQNQIKKDTEKSINQIQNAISVDINPAKEEFLNNLQDFSKGILENINGKIEKENTQKLVDEYLNREDVAKKIKNLTKKYIIPEDVFKKTYSSLLNGLLEAYINSYNLAMSKIEENMNKTPDLNNKNNININTTTENNNLESENKENLTQNEIQENSINLNNIQKNMIENHKDTNITNLPNNTIKETLINNYVSNIVVQKTGEKMGQIMTEAVVKKDVLTKVSELTTNLTKNIASSFNVDQSKIANSFKIKLTEEEITRIITAKLSKKESSAKLNLINFGYQDKEDPTYISFYFNSFDGKEHFINFINNYNINSKANNQPEKEINYTDTTGILMGSVKTIVNSVTYVLIAFVSISLVVSSFMIGIITYISVYERTKEIGILRAIGASKHNISSIFNAETFIIGLLSGLIGIGITYMLIPLINSVLHKFTGNVPLNAILYLSNASILIILSIILTLIGGIIPAKAASKKDPVIALRTE